MEGGAVSHYAYIALTFPSRPCWQFYHEDGACLSSWDILGLLCTSPASYWLTQQKLANKLSVVEYSEALWSSSYLSTGLGMVGGV